ncbi:MAG: glycosyltransferase family 2 protein [Thermogutta sp.]|jgi:glycosyltransferase involved in cell wall biosynthesis|nr:glycosyltransferase family 2 protein [Thermogutta sp.]HPU06647.1 glycosyltransferase family 2 protein [Thermogutta sp.]
MHRPILSVIIPVYNEAGTIERVLERVIDVWPEDKEIIVVDDGSQDGTAELLRQWYTQHCSVHGDCRERRNVRVMLLFHDRNRGKGSAIRTGLQYATGHYVVIQDADMEYDPADYRNLLAPLLNEEADVVYGSRRLGERMYSELNCMQKWVQIPRTWANPYYHGVTILNLLVRMWFRLRVTDEATCYKVLPLEVLRAMDLECERFEFCPEVTAKIARMGLRLKEVPIQYRGRSRRQGKKIRFRDGWEAICTLWRYRSWRPSKRPETEEKRCR